jgi:integrase
MSPVSPSRREGSPFFYIRRQIRGLGLLKLSTGTRSAALARQYDQLVIDLKELGRLDALRALKAGQVTIQELYANRLPAQLERLLLRGSSPELRALVKEFLARGGEDTGIRERSMQRYRVSWRRVLAFLPESARVGDLTPGFVSEFKRLRRSQAEAVGKTLSPATLNRDLAAVGAFLSWCSEEKGLKVERPPLRYQRECKGRVRWLSPEELAAFKAQCPTDWWPLFGLLFGTGITISEALGLQRTDLDLRNRRLAIHEEYGRMLKRASRARELSVPEALVSVLARYLKGQIESPDARVFPFTYWPARKAWHRICKDAGIYGATIHDARHTFAVHAVQDGIPEARLQRLLGHSHPGTTRRYAMHSPEQFLEADANRVARHMGMGDSAREVERLA